MSQMLPENKQKSDNDDATVSFDLRLETNQDLMSPNIREITIGSDTPRDCYELYLSNLETITFEVDQFSDGRIFSIVRWIKSNPQFKGKIKASGHFIPDQAQYLSRCGVDFVEGNDQWLDSEAYTEVVNLSVAYQSALSENDPIEGGDIRFRPQP